MAMVSVTDVAARAGVSVGTVSNVMNHPDKVAERTRERVLAAIDDLGFVRNDAARHLRDGRSTSIGLIVLDVRNPFFTDIARGAEDRAALAGLSVLLANSDENLARENSYLDLFEQHRVHGVLISPLSDNTAKLRVLRDRGIPAVLVDWAATDVSFSSVSVDDVAGGRLAVEHLIAQNRRHIAFLGGPLNLRQVADRLQGARQAAAAHPEVTLEVIELASLSVREGRAAATLIVQRPDRPDAIFAANDLVAIGVLQAVTMSHTGIAVPDDIALVGYDDIDFASDTVIALTSIRQPSTVIGWTAVDILVEEAADALVARRQIQFQPHLVIRASTVTA